MEASLPIKRTYACEACNHFLEVTLDADQWDAPAPECPACAVRLQQQFVPFGITGSNTARAHSIAEEIVASDYHAADFQREWRREGTPSVRYKDQSGSTPASAWSGVQGALEQAVAIGRQTRARFGGTGLDVLKANLASGAEPDLIANSKRKSIKVW